jgi:hypothetical protein
MRWILCFVVTVLLGAFVNGCSTCPRVDWHTRIGNYTYDQSVKELGVPDKYQKLSDNSIVAEWALHYYSPDYVTYGYTGGYWGHGWASPAFGYGYPTGPDYTRWLRLVFGPDAKLTMFKQYDR